MAADINTKVVQERLGHSQIGITLDIYSHVVPTMGLEAASKLDAVLAKKPSRKKRVVEGRDSWPSGTVVVS